MKTGNKRYKKEILLIIPLIIVLPLFSFFCYNLGKFSNWADTFQGTFNQYLPLLPVLLVAGFLLFRYASIKQS